MVNMFVVESSSSKLDLKHMNKVLSSTIEGACNANAIWKKGWQPPGQWYVKKETIGVYTIVHNLNTIKYSIVASLLKSPGTIEIRNLTDISFDLEIKEDSALKDRDFRFAVSIINGV